jgi:DNA-binding NarL/FixJ family response regulator
MELIRIVVADDHPVVRDGLVAILKTQPDFEVVAEVNGGQALIEIYADLLPDIVLLDLEMPDMDGVTALQKLRRDHPQIRAIAFTAYDSDERIVDAVRSGAVGYLLKGAPRRGVVARTLGRFKVDSENDGWTRGERPDGEINA